MSERRTEAELLAELRGCPKLLSRWRHYRGGEYVVTGRAVRECDGEPLVVYARPQGDWHSLVEFARPLREWQELVPHEGRVVPRFAPEGTS